ncbi:MAG: hypothetical protein ACPGQS_06225 [Bradymonadia bacterium]
MLSRFFCITLVPLCLIACEAEVSRHKTQQLKCISIKLKSTQVTAQDLADVLPRLETLPLATRKFQQHILAFIDSNEPTEVSKLRLAGQAFAMAKQTTLAHFMTYGRMLAMRAASIALPSPTTLHKLDLSKAQARAFFAKLADAPRSGLSSPSPRDQIFRYVLLLWSWSTLLDQHVQVKQWWSKAEYRWLLEAQALGYIETSLADRKIANEALRGIKDYPYEWNAAALSLKLGEPLPSHLSNNLLTDDLRRCFTPLEFKREASR